MQQIENINPQLRFRAERAAILRCVSRGRLSRGRREDREAIAVSEGVRRF